MLEKAIELTDANFKDTLADATGILFFYKKLCPNCKAMKTVVEKFTAGKNDIDVMQIDSEDNPEAMKALGVERVPALLVIKKGNIAARKVGLMNVKQLTAFYKSA